MTNPLGGKGPNSRFQFGKANDVIDTADLPDGGYNIDCGAGDLLVGGNGSDIIVLQGIADKTGFNAGDFAFV